MAETIFTKIINRELPAIIHYENDEFIVFNDIQPMAPIHVLVVPKKAYQTLEEVDLEDTEFHAKLLQTARRVASQLGIADNYKMFINVGLRLQAVPHLHLHLLGGWQAELAQENLAKLEENFANRKEA